MSAQRASLHQSRAAQLLVCHFAKLQYIMQSTLEPALQVYGQPRVTTAQRVAGKEEVPEGRATIARRVA